MTNEAAGFLVGLGVSSIGLALLLLLALLFSCYVRVATVLGIVRIGFGFQSLPSVFVVGGLAIALSFFVMFPTIQNFVTATKQVLVSKGTLTDADKAAAIDAGIAVWKQFLVAHTAPAEVKNFLQLAQDMDKRNVSTTNDTTADSWRVLAPAFLVSELKGAFSTGISIFLPFLVIDLIVIAVLAAVGFERMSPTVLALPFKLLLFVVVDGWGIITRNLIASY